METIEKEIERYHQDLKRWNDLYEDYSECNDYLEEYAKPRAEAWTKKIFLVKKQKELLEGIFN